MTIDEIKERVPLLDFMQDEGHEFKRQGQEYVCLCPLHEERTPSFSVNPEKRLFVCRGCAAGGDILSYVALRDRISAGEAKRRLESSMSGSLPVSRNRPPAKKPTTEESPAQPRLPHDFHRGSIADFEAVARLRRLSTISIATADKLGTLYFGTICGFRSWILTDERRLCAEARRMDGEPYPEMNSLPKRKAHTLAGSKKDWPVGLVVRGFELAEFRALLLVEGGPDYLAALHFTMQHHGDCLPIAFLGVGAGKHIRHEALTLMGGRRVRIYPHVEESDVGRNASERWAEQLVAAGCDPDCYSFADLRIADGDLVKDLNDAVRIHPAQAADLEDLLP